MKRLANPVVIVEHRLDPDAIWIWAQQIHPLVRPEVRVLRILQQSIHQTTATIF